jgi:hypothetical protein
VITMIHPLPITTIDVSRGLQRTRKRHTRKEQFVAIRIGVPDDKYTIRTTNAHAKSAGPTRTFGPQIDAEADANDSRRKAENGRAVERRAGICRAAGRADFRRM